uniref:Uncharacterized protein n=1 Tax=Mycena chlorophos TaxID=658473 RepID=A0ABQ0KVP1_MYCCL|nr:predicted protein [Mycena chlorophos]
MASTTNAFDLQNITVVFGPGVLAQLSLANVIVSVSQTINSIRIDVSNATIPVVPASLLQSAAAANPSAFTAMVPINAILPPPYSLLPPAVNIAPPPTATPAAAALPTPPPTPPQGILLGTQTLVLPPAQTAPVLQTIQHRTTRPQPRQMRSTIDVVRVERPVTFAELLAQLWTGKRKRAQEDYDEEPVVEGSGWRPVKRLRA